MADLEFTADFTDLQLMRRELLGVAKDAKQSAGVFEREYNRVEKQINRVAKANQAYFNSVLGVDRAVKSASASASVFERELNRKEKQLVQTTRATSDAAAAAQRLAAAQRIAGKDTNRFGMYAQQVGYQVGDFFVQVQSGTNAMVAFGQQGTQLAGLLPGLSGAIIGIGLSLGTMLGGMWMRTRTEMQDTEKVVNDLREALEMLEQIDLSNATSQVSQFAAQATYKYSVLLEEIRKVAEEERARGFSTILDSFAPTSEIESRRKSIEQMVKLANDAGMETNANIETQKRLLQDQLKTREILLTIEGQTRQETAENLNNALALLSSNGLLTNELRTQLTTFAEQSGLISAIQSDMEAVTKEIDDQNKKQKSTLSLAESFKSVMENITINNLLSQMDSLNSKLGSAIFGAGTMSARLRGLFDAGVAAAERAVYAQQIGGGRSMGRGGPTAEEIQNYDPRAQIAYTPGGSAGIPLPKIRGSSGGGGGGSAKTQEDYVGKLLKEAEQKRKLIGLSEEETRRQEILYQLREKGLPTDDKRIEQVIQLEAETRKLMEAEQQREQLMNTVEGHIKSAFMSFVDGSKSVEDAFRTMLRNIILAVYEQQVAKPAATAIGGLFDTAIKAIFPSANGNVFNQGMHVKAYANGGVVNRTTAFPMRGGVGIMGEAGPEAIMPLKRGKNGKLGVQMEGSEGNVTVNQYFSISANGDESVKKVVAGEMPKYMQATKAAVLDAKRRGGSYGRSF